MSKLILAAAVVLALGLIAIAARLDTRLPAVWQQRADEAPASVPVIQTLVTDQQPIKLTLNLAAPKEIVSGTLSGLVTGIPHNPGELIGCGSTVIQVDSVDRPLFCGPVPLHRSLGQIDTTGPDVEALHTFLANLGFDVGVIDPDEIGPALRRAIVAYRKQYGLPAGRTFEPSFVVYAETPIPVGETSTAVGRRVEADQVLVMAAPQISNATFTYETRLSDLDHVVVLNGTPVAVDTTTNPGTITDLETLAEALATTEFTENKPVNAEVRLANDLTVLSVPSGAVISDEDTLCVVEQSSGTVHIIDLVDSFAGTAFFRPIDDLANTDVVFGPANIAAKC